jgi:hypothetical protein
MTKNFFAFFDFVVKQFCGSGAALSGGKAAPKRDSKGCGAAVDMGGGNNTVVKASSAAAFDMEGGNSTAAKTAPATPPFLAALIDFL